MKDFQRYAIDAVTALRIVREDLSIGARRALVGPAVLRSDVLAALYAEVRSGALDERTAREQLDALATLKIRLLGDRVSRMTAFTLATRLDTEQVTPLEYVAVASLQADAIVCGDPVIAQLAAGVVPTASFDELRG
jgi:hypothetical protein